MDLSRRGNDAWDIAETALLAILGTGVGVVTGFITAEYLGRVDRERVQRAVRRVRHRDPEAELDGDTLESEALGVLSSDPRTRGLDVRPEVLRDGIIELVGRVHDEAERHLAGRLVRDHTSATAVINRILVSGVDVPAGPRAVTDLS